MRSMRIAAVVAALVVVGVAGSVSVPAQARWGRHCAARLEPVGAKDRHGVISARAVDIGCFPTFAEALFAGSGGAVRVPAGTTPAGLTRRLLAASSTAAPTVRLIGTEFTGFAYGADSRSYFAPTACAGGDVWELSYVGEAWNDVFESGKGFGGCDRNRKFAAAGFTGGSVLCTPNCPDYGVLDMEVSSLRWRP